MFKCRGCAAKDDEIRHLLALLDKVQAAASQTQARLAEIASPGAERRRVAEPVLRVPFRTPPSPPELAASFPGYEPTAARAGFEVVEST